VPVRAATITEMLTLRRGCGGVCPAVRVQTATPTPWSQNSRCARAPRISRGPRPATAVPAPRPCPTPPQCPRST